MLKASSEKVSGTIKATIIGVAILSALTGSSDGSYVI